MPDNRIGVSFPDDADINAQARQWLVYLYSGEATEEGRSAFSQWLKSNGNNPAAFASTEQIWRDCGFAAGEESDCLADTATASPVVLGGGRVVRPSSVHPSRLLALLMTLAAILLIFVGFWQFQSHSPVTRTVYTSGVGEVETFVLEDHSTVTLGAESRLVATMSDSSRQIELVEGGAYFDVAHQPESVFLVNVAKAQVRVIGTEFEIQKVANAVRVSVGRGIVDVRIAQSHETSTRSAHPVRLLAGQGIMVTHQGELGEILSIDTSKLSSWRRGRLVYVDTPLEDVLSEVNRYRTDKIVLMDKSLKDILITASFKSDETSKLLTGLRMTTPVKIESKGNRVIVRRNPPENPATL